MRKQKKNSELWNYLNSVGVLENGTDEQIKTAKRQYRKRYLLTYKQQQRKENPEFNVMLSKEDGEYETVSTAAKKNSLPISAFLKTATLAYINQFYIVPNRVQLAHMEQLLADCLNEVQTITKTKERFFWDREQKYEAIEKRIMKLEAQIREVISNPPLASPNDSQIKKP